MERREAPKLSSGMVEEITLRIPVERLAQYAGLTALASALLVGAGMLATVAYLSAWGIPASLVRLDPFTATVRAELVVYQLVLLGAVLFGLAALARRSAGQRWRTRAAFGAAAVALALLSWSSVAAGFWGPVLAVAGGVALYVGLRRRRLSGRAAVILYVAIALVSAYLTGHEYGRMYRADAERHVRVVLTTRTPVGGLPDGVADGNAWRYEGLYLVFRDGETLYLSRGGSSRVWLVSMSAVASFTIEGARAVAAR